ncbi:MAG: hypothetical protein KC656_34565 [Myxococcales bacterium]|nr:hypothetical protein [Myxococcales bacterium]MCB9665280.1 hypothetical protein [Alphaproteobacteria bacterium]
MDEQRQDDGADVSGPTGHVVQRLLALAVALAASIVAALWQALRAALGLRPPPHADEHEPTDPPARSDPPPASPP